MRDNDCKVMIEQVMDRVRNLIYSRNLAFSALRLVFLKYALDNCIGANTKEDMQQYVRAQKVFASKDIENGIDTIIPILKHIDKAYGFDQVFAHPVTIDDYARELFGFDRLRQKKNTSGDGFKELVGYLGNLDLEENNGATLGKAIVDAMLEIIRITSVKNSFSAEYTTSSSISAVAKAILKIEDKDRFVDFASGMGISTIEIVRDACPVIINIEKDGSNAAISAMLYIMQGYENLQIVCADSITNVVDGVQGNKLFVDLPLAAKVEKTPSNEYSDMTLAAINRILSNYLIDDGIAVMTVSGGVLFQMKEPAQSLRGKIVKAGRVKAVITLPPLLSHSMANTNLLVLSKQESNSRCVVFVDAVQPLKRVGGKNQIGVISDELINRIVSAIENKETTPEFSSAVSIEKISEKGYSLVPANYIELPKEKDDITMEELNAKLEELYRLLLQ